MPIEKLRRRRVAFALVVYALSCVLIIGVAGGLLTAVFSVRQETTAVWVSAFIALVIQIPGFAIARKLTDKGHGMAGWAMGAVLCVVVLAIFGLCTPALGLPQAAALVSLATYFSLTELIEGPFLFL